VEVHVNSWYTVSPIVGNALAWHVEDCDVDAQMHTIERQKEEAKLRLQIGI
jgi:hypothetical protein